MYIFEKETELGVGVYAGRGLTLVRGSGARLWDDEGRQYIDCTSGIGVANIGYGNVQLAEAIHKQALELITCAGVFANDVRIRCMEKLIEITPQGLDRVFLCNSGAESVEAAIKFARQATGRSGVVSATGGFHGRTMGALSATHKADYQEPFAPLVPGFTKITFNDIEAVERTVDYTTAALILELVQGEGGVRLVSQDYVRQISNICKERGVLLILDEVQTGFCRTGRMFACEHYEIVPDILCLAKAIAGGMPMGATLINEKVSLEIGTHGSTFGGNPLACAAALATIEIMEQQQLADKAVVLGKAFVQQLEAAKPVLVRDIRHLGLMIGIELRKRATPVLKQLQNDGVLALPAGDKVIRLLPPLVISKSDLDIVCNKLVALLNAG